jgi:hypothetical protein
MAARLTAAQARAAGINVPVSADRSAKTKSNIGKGKEAALGVQKWCRLAGLPVPTTEHPYRRFKFDLCWNDLAIAVEIQGGSWSKNGAHGFGENFARDCEKHNEAMLDGWTVLIVTYEHLKSGKAHDWIERAIKGAKTCAQHTGGNDAQ